MKKISLIILSVALVAMLFSSALPVMAAKPPKNGAGKNVIELSNGFPSGFHFNLNIHGKNPETFTTPSPPPYDPPYGNSIFIPEFTDPYGPITIECISDKKGVGTELEVIDPYAMPTSYKELNPTPPPEYIYTPTNFENADDLAQFRLPYKIQTDGGVVDSNGYYVYGRILGKPNNSAKKDGDPSSIIVSPNPILQVDSEGAAFPLGLLTAQGSYELDGQEFIRFDDTSSLPNGKGKGRSIAKNITDMFMWTGWVINGSLDTNDELESGDPDGQITYHDIPEDYYDGVNYNHDYNGDGIQDEADVHDWLTDLSLLDPSLARYYEDWWVFDIAEMVTQSWGIENDGTKLLQIRFYPVATTTFTEKAHIVVKKITKTIDDTTTLFDFEATYRNSWQMTSDQFCLSQGLEAGDYEVTELAEEGWDLTRILIEDPTGGSTSSVGDRKAYINLAEGETVTVTFENDTQWGQIIVDKVTDPSGDSQLFDFSLTGGPDTINRAFQLADATAPYKSGAIKPGTYSLAETVPSGWDLTSATCSDLSPVGAIILDLGETVTVTFNNVLLTP